jgi:hypothetical protein
MKDAELKNEPLVSREPTSVRSFILVFHLPLTRLLVVE